jgi:POT family proton-dependent oligopeptide transporter
MSSRSHPTGLYVLFFTEAWERFSYYGMRALLVYYMTKQLFRPGHLEHVLGHGTVESSLVAVFGPLAPQAFASQIYGLYTALTYLTPLFGGILADRVLGARRSVVLGGALMALAQFTLMEERFFYLGLLLLIVGNGAFKPNISTQVGALYAPDDPRRDRAFNVFYVGINLGAWAAPLVCGTLGETLGWRWGFAAAGIGMLLGLVVYVLGAPTLGTEPPRLASTTQAPLSKKDWTAVGALVVLCLLNVPYWAVYEQQGNTLALWVDTSSDRRLFGIFGSSWQMPATWFQSVNPAFIFLLTWMVNPYWSWQARRGKEPSSVAKMAIGSGLLAVSYLVMALVAHQSQGGLASLWWLILSTGVLTLGEIYLSPVGLSLVTKVAPVRLVSMMMGLWLLSSFFGNYLSGALGMFWDRWTKESFFLVMASLGAATSLAFVLLAAPLRRALGEQR